MGPQRPDTAEMTELQTLIPLLANHFRRAPGEMPARLRAVFQANGLSNRHGAVLARLRRTGPVTVGELARQLGVGLTNGSQLVADLDHAGCVERHTDPDDRRRTLVSLRHRWHADVDEFLEQRTAVMTRVVARLTPAERRGFLAGVRAWVRELEDAPEETPAAEPVEDSRPKRRPTGAGR